MRYFILLILIVACSGKKDKLYPTKDSTELKYLYSIKNDLGSLMVTDSSALIELEASKKLVDSLIQKSLEKKEEKLDIELLKVKHKRLLDKYREEKIKADTLTIKNKELAQRCANYEKELAEVSKLTEKYEVATYVELPDIDLTEITVKGLSSTPEATEEIYTSKRNKLRFIRVTAKIPNNRREGTYLIRGELWSIDNKNSIYKDLHIDYTGKEQIISLYLGDIDFEVGAHTVKLYINGNVYFETLFNVTR